MTAVNRFKLSDMPMSDAGFPTHDDIQGERMKLYGGYKPMCMRCALQCKQWNCKTLEIIYCPGMVEKQ